VPLSRTDRLERLIAKGEMIPLLDHDKQPMTGDKRVEPEDFAAWFTQTLAFLRVSFGASSTYTEMFEERVTDSRERDVETGIGILRGLLEDVRMDEQDDSEPLPELLSQVEREQLEIVAGDVRRVFDENSLGLEGDDAAEFASDLQTLEDQARSPRPKREIVRVAFRSVHAFINRPIPAGFLGGAVLLAAQTLMHAIG
jgi:hypothetical protein